MLVIAGRRWFISVPPPRPRPPLPGGAPLRRPGRRCLAYCRVTGRSGGGGGGAQNFLWVFLLAGGPARGRGSRRLPRGGGGGGRGVPGCGRPPGGRRAG